MVQSRQVVAKQVISLGEGRGPARADKPGAKAQSQRVGVKNSRTPREGTRGAGWCEFPGS